MLKRIRSALHYTYEHPVYIFLVLLVIEAIAVIITEFIETSITFHWLSIVLRVLIAIYFFFSLAHAIRISLRHMLDPKNLLSLSDHILYLS